MTREPWANLTVVQFSWWLPFSLDVSILTQGTEVSDKHGVIGIIDYITTTDKPEYIITRQDTGFSFGLNLNTIFKMWSNFFEKCNFLDLNKNLDSK